MVEAPNFHNALTSQVMVPRQHFVGQMVLHVCENEIGAKNATTIK